MTLAAAAAAAGAPSYRRLYDSAMRLLESELKLEPYPIPTGLEGNSAVVGKGRSQQVHRRSDKRMECLEVAPFVMCQQPPQQQSVSRAVICSAGEKSKPTFVCRFSLGRWPENNLSFPRIAPIFLDQCRETQAVQ